MSNIDLYNALIRIPEVTDEQARRAAEPDTSQLATKADLYKMAVTIIGANTAITFGLLKLLLP